MPRQASQCRSWEKERRERFKKEFEELTKVLPSYDPSVKISKIEILKQAHTTIIELREEVKGLTTSTQEKTTFKDEQIKKLQERIKKLLVRNEQLTKLFKDAGIKAPKFYFRRLGIFSNRTTPEQAKILQQKEMEKENVLSGSSRAKPKRRKPKQTKVPKTINMANRVKKLNKLRKASLASNGLLLLSHIPTVPAINQQLVFVPNTPLQNVSRGSRILTIPCTQPVTSKPTAGLTPVNLRSGTMILGNANIISVLPQPQIMIPPLTLPSQTVMFSKAVKKTKANGAVASSTADTKKNLRLHPRSCVTSTTQVNKVPIPALTSKYANTSALLHYSDNCSKQEKRLKKSCTNRKVMIPKRKISVKNEAEVKKKKSEEINNEADKNCATDETNNKQKFDAVENTENITSKNMENSPELVESSAKTPPCIISESSKAVETPDDTIQNKMTEEKMQSVPEVPVDSAKPDKDNSPVISENSDMTANFTTTSASYTSTDTLSVSAQEDAIKNIDLNLVHSDLSNDIFASLQVPPGCQNTESTSPTAAFLLAFPLVSSIKVTEVIDEENSDSQRETPTLLQIGGMDPKASHNDTLLNLDNFPFFNPNYYNSKIEANSGNVNLDKRTLDGKLENESFNIFTETNGQAASYEMESKKKLDNQENQRNVEQFLLYEDKTPPENVKLKNFQEPLNEVAQNSHNKQDPRKNYNQLNTDKLQTTCNTYTNYGMCQDNLLPPSISTSNIYNLSDNLLYKNYNEKTAQPSVGKQLFSNENIFKPTDKLFSNHQKDFNTPKDPKINQNSNCNNKNAYHPYNFFELPRSSKEMTFNPTESCSNKENPTKAAEICPKLKETKTSCFPSNYSSTTNVSSTKTAPCTYATPKKSNPFYTNCNYSYNYSDQSYYKPDAKPAYSLSYENYQEYRKTDTFFCNNVNRKNEKPVNQNKTVNWMTEQKSQPSDCFLPTFTNQSYSFTSCISTDTSDVNKKSTDLADKRFSWSPTKLPNFLEPAHNFITPTLPTLVGDLALGNSLPINEAKTDYKYTKEPKKKMFDSTNQANFLSVSQLVNQSKTEINNVPGRTAARRQSGNTGNKAKANVMKSKRPDKNLVKSVNSYDMFYDQKNKNPNKNVLSNYSAESLIGNPQNTQETKKCSENSAKPICSSNFFADNIVPYFSTMEDGYINQDPNSHNTYNTHNSFQNNNFPPNSFMYSTPSINSSYLEGSHEYSSQNVMNYCGIKYNKNFNNNKNPRGNTKEDKASYPSNVRKGKKITQGNFDYSLLPIQSSTNSPVLTDDFQSHTFLPPAAPFTCKNSLNQKQGNEFNSGPLLPLPGISKNHIQHPGVSPSLNNAGTSLTNFNLSTIFPEINKGTTPNLHNNSNKSKTNSIYLESPFNADSKYGFLG